MIKKVASLLTLIIVYACATVQGPTGGDKDEVPPKLYQSNPANQSIKFKGQEIKLFFSEWMKLEQLDKELIITPREDIKYEASLKKQELTIELEEPLQDSTTYTFNFRKALKDITEGNLWQNPVIAFSTGPYLDSLQISGTVTKLKDNTVKEGYIVGLYTTAYDTANLRQGKPVYFTTTDKNGQYQMKNLRNGKYRLYTFQDNNDDLLNNSQNEAFGFHTEIIDLYDSIGTIDVNTYKRNEDTLRLKKYSPVGKDFIIQYNKGLVNYQLTNPSDSNQYIYTNNIENSKYLKVYKENFPQLNFDTDSTLLMVKATDSIGSQITDSVYFRLRESRLTNDTIKIIDKPKAELISGKQEFLLTLSKPVNQIIYDSIQLRIDSIPIYTFSPEDIEQNFSKKQIKITTTIVQSTIDNIIDSLSVKHQKLLATDSLKDDSPDTTIVSDTNTKKEAMSRDLSRRTSNIGERQVNTSPSTSGKLQLYFGKSAFRGIENDSSQQTEVSLSFKKIEDHGTITGKIINPGFPFVVQLLNDKYEVIDTLVNQHDYKFNYVKPGKYRLRLLKDINNNQVWDAGNVYTLEKPEEYIFFNEEITVKANWEIIDKDFDLSVDKQVDSSVKN
ncbi:Ig-like domain-containing domain [uncultured Marivirga sp.]|uniref:Ig-like domain-containing domain n=1 Tax=uncultured Marivirga sp. TaxID=1123707 RepID=UPI0030EBBB9C|tara:strand:- start:91912 stop:93753 length:1842 start_codon:yes stop_codon:yes gene_type:complete